MGDIDSQTRQLSSDEVEKVTSRCLQDKMEKAKDDAPCEKRAEVGFAVAA